MKAIEQYVHVVLFIMLYKVVLTFKFVDETLVCDHSNKDFELVLSLVTFYYCALVSSNFSGYNVPRVCTAILKKGS